MPQGPHYPLIQRILPTWLNATSWSKAQALSGTPLTRLPGLLRTAAQAHAAPKRANAQAWTTQNAVEQRLANVQELYAFARPLLTQALRERFALNLDVTATHLFLLTAKGNIIQGTTSRTVSLLDAALHNFADHERFTVDSSYISRPDERGHFMIEPHKRKMSIEQFVSLCRELDLGARYQAHLAEHLLPAESMARQTLQAEVIASQQAALNRAAHLTRLNHKIDTATLALLQRTLNGERGVMQFYQLRMRDTLLTGILMVAADLDNATTPARIVVYIPHDPHGELYDYPDSQAFMRALLKKLEDEDYQLFFSRFVDQSQRGHFFAPQASRTLFGAERIDGDLWPFLYRQSLNKVLNDGRELAVSTAQADSRERWAWWDNFSRVLTEVFNVALLVVTPFVPLLGELTLAYTAYQLLDEVVEGAVDLLEGQAQEAARHLLDVVSTGVQLAAFGVGAQLVQSAFINQLKPIEVNGRPRLWNADPRPYQQPDAKLPHDSIADDLGLHTHQGNRYLPVDDNLYAVARDPASGEHRVLHPSRPEAYAPPLLLNDTPSAWSERQLARSLGPYTEPQLKQILATSGIDPAVLRAAKAQDTTPALLEHSIKRFALNHEARQLPERLRAGEPVDDDTYWSAQMARELPGWPADRAIDVYESPDLSGDCLRYGETDATQVLKISRQDLKLGLLPERLVAFFDQAHLRALLGDAAQGDPVDALRQRLADTFAQRQPAVFDYLYRNADRLADAPSVQVREAFPELPADMIHQVVAQARPNELTSMAQQQRVPLRLRNLARELQLQVRGVHGFEGFFEPALINADTERMALNTLRLHSDALRDVRLEIRNRGPNGRLSHSVGAADARRVRVLVRNNSRQHLIYDNQARLLLRDGDLFEAILHALPADRRAELGFTPADSERFKTWLMDKIATPEQRRVVLDSPGMGVEPTVDAHVLTQKPMHRLSQWRSQLFQPTLQERIRTLYPYAEPSDIEAYLTTLQNPEHLQRFEAREAEKTELQNELRTWINQAAHSEPASRTQRRLRLSQALIRAWEHNLNPGPNGIGVNFNGVSLQGLLGNLRLKANFSHVMQLDLIDAQLLDSDMPFLENFSRLSSLNLQGNELTRLPQPVTRMNGLRELALDDNPIQWDAASRLQLSHLPWLQHLWLGGNRLLTVAPDISGMPFLRSLSLRNTGIREWPDGLFARQRPMNFALDLQNTAIDHVPQFLPWEPAAELVARTRLDRNRLTPEAENTFVGYRLATGLDPHRNYPPRGDAAFWLVDEKPEHQPWLKALWDELEQEHGAQGFFEVLKSLEQPEVFEDPLDQLRYQSHRRELASKVWRLLIAMQGDEALRTRVFMLASNPVTCADAGLHVFNAIGLEFELNDVLRNLSGAEQERQLVRLAQGKSRLERLNRVAQADIRERIKPVEDGGQGLRFSTQMVDGQPGTVDEVEVYLAYQSALKERLALPWVSEHMAYRVTAHVDTASISAAHDSVLAMEAGDGLVDGMLEQPFWDHYLRSAHADAFQASLDRANALLDPLDDLMFAQKEWASSSERSDALKQKLLHLADALNVPHDQVLTGEPMSSQTYERILTGGLPGAQDLARRLTHEALARRQAHEADQR